MTLQRGQVSLSLVSSTSLSNELNEEKFRQKMGNVLVEPLEGF